MRDSVSGEAKKPRHRSPNYPAIGLREAMEKVDMLYQADKKAGAPIDAALRHMGFTSRHGKAMVVLSALKKFGLVEEIDGRAVPTKRAIEILVLTEDDPRRAAALREAALNPDIYRELVEQFKHTGMPSDQTLAAELEAYKGFNPNAVGDFVADFRDTLNFAGLTKESELVSEMEIGDQLPIMRDAVRLRVEAPMPVGLRSGSAGSSSVSGSIQVVKEIVNQRVSPSCVAQVVFDGIVTKRAVEKLIAYLQLAKDDYPDDSIVE